MVSVRDILDLLENFDINHNVYVFCDDVEIIEWFRDMGNYETRMKQVFTRITGAPEETSSRTDHPCIGYCIGHDFYPYLKNIKSSKVLQKITLFRVTEDDLDAL